MYKIVTSKRFQDSFDVIDANNRNALATMESFDTRREAREWVEWRTGNVRPLDGEEATSPAYDC